MLFTKTGRLGQEQVRREQDRNHGENKTPVTYSWRNMLQAVGHVNLSSKGGLGLKTSLHMGKLSFGDDAKPLVRRSIQGPCATAP